MTIAICVALMCMSFWFGMIYESESKRTSYPPEPPWLILGGVTVSAVYILSALISAYLGA